MKKLLLMVVVTIVSMLNVKADNEANLSWDSLADTFVSSLNADKAEYEAMFAEVGVDAGFKASYDKAKKSLVLNFAFDPDMYDVLTGYGMANEIKNLMLEGYREDYKQDADFKEFVDIMKKNNATFTMRFASKADASKKVDFIITPQEIIN